MAQKRQDDETGFDDEARAASHQSTEDELIDRDDRDYGWDEGDPADRRKDPLRKP